MADLGIKDRHEETSGLRDWESCRVLLHRIVDDLVNDMSRLPAGPVWQPMEEEDRKMFHSDVPWEGISPEKVYEDLRRRVLPFNVNNNHPRFFGWVLGSTEPISAAASFIAAATNPSVSFFDQSAALVEQEVLGWLSEIIGFPKEACSGLLVSGCSMANFLGIACAREAILEATQGSPGSGDLARLRLYASSEQHGSVAKACRLLGLSREAVRKIESEGGERLSQDSLRVMIDQDRRDGKIPFCVVGTAGGVRSGVIDDLRALATVCHEEKLWFHVDGAFGALLRLCPKLRNRVDGIEYADSLACDLHKFGLQPVGSGVFLTRHPELHRKLFGAGGADYVVKLMGSASDSRADFTQLGLEFTRRFAALGLWLSWRSYGVNRVAEIIENAVKLAQQFKAQIASRDELELVGRADLNIVNFRFRAPDMTEGALEIINKEILVRCQRRGHVMLSSAWISERFCLRVAVVNHLAEAEDLDRVLLEVTMLGAELQRGM